MSESLDADTSYKFDAFASYSTDPDYRVVRKTESFLESFHKLGESTGVELKRLQICVDGSDFEVSKRGGGERSEADPVSNLITDNLARSRRLILFCSANAARSPWVDQEIRWFLEHRDPDSVLVVVTEGRDPGAHPEECFPKAAIAAGLHQKPWYDLRQAKSASKTWEKVKDITDERVRLAAHLNDRSAGDIVPLWRREDRLGQRRRLWIATAVAAALLVLAAAAVWFGINAEMQRRLTVARLLASQSDARLDASGEGLQQSLLLATESLRHAWTADGYASWARAVALAPRRPELWLDTNGASVVALDQHPERAWLAMACSDGLVRVVELDSDSSSRELRLGDGPLPPPAQWPGAVVKFSLDGAWLAGAANHRLSIWDTTSWERTDIDVNTDGYFDLAFDRSSELLAVGGYDAPLRLFEAESWRERRPPDHQNARFLRAIDFTDTHLVAASRSGEIALWELRANQSPPVEVLRIDSPDSIHDIALGTEQTLALVTERPGLSLWSTKTIESALLRAGNTRDEANKNKLPRLAAQELEEIRGSWNSIQVPPAHSVRFSPRGDYLATGAATVGSPIDQYDTATRLWNARDGRELARIHPGGPAAFVPGRDALVIGGANAGVWPLPARRSLTSLAHSSNVDSVAFSPDGRWLAAGLEEGKLVVRRTGSLTEEFVTTLGGSVGLVGFTPDSGWLIVHSRESEGARLPMFCAYKTDTWQAIPSKGHEDGFVMRVAPDSRFLSTHTQKSWDRYEGLKRASRTRIWEIATGKEVAWRSHEKDDERITGKVSIAEGTLPLGEEGDLNLLEQAADWPLLRPRPRGPGGMNVENESPDGRWLAGHGGRGASEGIALLEPTTGRQLVTLRPDATRIASVDFSPDGHLLATAEGPSVDIWLLGPVDALIDEACSRLARNLTAEEWSLFLDEAPRATCDD